jgi:hypothetical protein
MTCPHKRCLFVPDFIAWQPVCSDCGEQMPRPGIVGGIRDYYVPGDPPWRRMAEVLKAAWLADDLDGDLYQCPECCYVETADAFDCLGADAGNFFCNECGAEFAAVACSYERPPMPLPKQKPLFT